MRFCILLLCALSALAQSKKYEIQQPKGPWRTPGEIQKPTGPWLVPKDIQGVRAIQSTCESRLVLSADTLFAFDKSELTPQAQSTLSTLGPMLKEKAAAHSVIVEGHTDAIGTDSYNQTLSEQRAAAVRDWLLAKEYLRKDASRMQGFGRKRPAAPNTFPDGKDNPDGRAKNRRVEIAINTCH